MRHLRRLIGGSIGRKQAGVTFLLILVATLASYVKVSHSQRDSLLFAREASASAVTRLFADYCAAAVIFEDDAAIDAALATLAHNDEVEYAAVWRVDKSGQPGKRLGELRRGRELVPGPAALASPLRRETNRLIATAPVRDEKGVVLAVASVSFSLEREVRAIAQARRTTLVYSAGAGLAVILLLMAMAKVVITGPLGKLVAAAKELEKGGRGDVQIQTIDEVGQLARAFTSMASAIRTREEHINLRNQDMRLVLDNVGQGFLTLDAEGTVAEERSRVIDEWFGPAEGKPKFWEYLRHIDVSVAEYFEVGWSAVRDDVLPLSLCFDQLPTRVIVAGRVLELAYRPIMESERLVKAIVVITDITIRVERERAERAQRELMSLFRRMRSDPMALQQFFVESGALIDDIVGCGTDGGAPASDQDLIRVKRQIHTIKGNCALYGIESIAVCCHELETSMSESGTFLARDEQDQLRTLWVKVLDMRALLMEGTSTSSRVEIDAEEHASFIAALVARADRDQLVTRALSWRDEPAAQRLALVAEQVRALAQRLGKPEVTVICEPTTLRLPPAKWGPLWSAFSHVVRNAVDHGVEAREERALAGKSSPPTVVLSVVHERAEVIVTIEDDGRGIDWERIADVAASRGLPHATPADLQEALFADTVSSRTDRVTATSGRGIGLGAVREVVVNRLGGRVEIRSERGRGTRFRLRLPESMLTQEADGPVRPPGPEAAQPPPSSLTAALAEINLREIRR